MIKRVIFDLDDTLIPWDNNYFKDFMPVMIEYGVIDSKEDILKFVKAINDYEKFNNRYDDKIFIEYINEMLNKNISEEFYNKLNTYFQTCVPKKIDKNILEVLEYLKDKYELVILTNFFEELQIKRLENYGIKNYFMSVIGGNKYIKPHKQSYLIACGEHNPSECVMIGDNYINDVEGAIKNGLQAIYLNLKNDKVDKEITSISNLIELKNIL